MQNLGTHISLKQVTTVNSILLKFWIAEVFGAYIASKGYLLPKWLAAGDKTLKH